MKNILFKSCPLEFPEMYSALRVYKKCFPGKRMLTNGKSPTSVYGRFGKLVKVYETKTQIVLEVLK